MQRLLDYNARTGCWLTLTAASAPAARAADQAGQAAGGQSRLPAGGHGQEAPGAAASPIRRLLRYTVSGQWRTDCEEPARAAAEELQQLRDDAFFGLDVKEIPAEKWREIAPLFER